MPLHETTNTCSRSAARLSSFNGGAAASRPRCDNQLQGCIDGPVTVQPVAGLLSQVAACAGIAIVLFTGLTWLPVVWVAQLCLWIAGGAL